MSPKEAYNFLKKEAPNKDIALCLDFGKYFLFTSVKDDVMLKHKNGMNIMFDSSFVVDKKNGNVSVYNPLELDIGSEYDIVEHFK